MKRGSAAIDFTWPIVVFLFVQWGTRIKLPFLHSIRIYGRQGIRIKFKGGLDNHGIDILFETTKEWFQCRFELKKFFEVRSHTLGDLRGTIHDNHRLEPNVFWQLLF